MASLVGHLLGAGAAWAAARRVAPRHVPRSAWWYTATAGLAIAPDLDVVIPVLFGQHVHHRGATHSILFAATAGLVTALIGWSVLKASGFGPRPLSGLRTVGLGSFGALWAALFACALTHPLLDYLMACGPPVPFLWPWSERGWLSPLQLIPTAYYATSAGGLLDLVFLPQTWHGIGLEALSLGGLWAAVAVRSRTLGVLLLLVSAVAFLITLVRFR
jgi:inner membrane protein